MRNRDLQASGGDYNEIDHAGKSRHGVTGKTVDCNMTLKQDSSAGRFQTEGSVLGAPQSSLLREPRDGSKHTPGFAFEEVGATSKLSRVRASVADTPQTTSPKNLSERLHLQQSLGSATGQKKPVPGLLLYNKLNVKLNKGAVEEEETPHNKFSLLNNVQSHLTFGTNDK